MEDQPDWQRPAGVTTGLWEYVHRPAIANDYDDYFQANRLFGFEQGIVEQYCELGRDQGEIVADLGCGTGRALMPLVELGFRGLAVDLSEHMLAIVRAKAEAQQLHIQCLRANLVELDCIADNSIQHAICLFSTLGMIQGRATRDKLLSHVRRMLKPGGRFVLHVHNYWYGLHDPGGPWWLLRNFLSSIFRRDVEVGDKFFHYRGVTNMFLHVFRARELKRDLRRAGFRVLRLIPLAPQRYRALRLPRLLGGLRANGWIIIGE